MADTNPRPIGNSRSGNMTSNRRSSVASSRGGLYRQNSNMSESVFPKDFDLANHLNTQQGQFCFGG